MPVDDFPNDHPSDPEAIAFAALDTAARFGHGAYQAATRAADHLQGARRSRRVELVEKLADAIAYTERLKFVVEGDVRANGIT